MSTVLGSVLQWGWGLVGGPRPPSAPPQMPPLAPPPAWGPPAMPALQTPRPPGLVPLVGAPAPQAASYAGTFDTGVACLPCLRGHASTGATAAALADDAAQAGDQEGAKAAVVQAAAEVTAFHVWDLTTTKIAATKPADLAVIQQALPSLDASLEGIPLPPAPVLGAYAATTEAHRFAVSEEPSADDAREIAERIRPALRWMDEAERITLAPAALAAMPPEQRAAAAAASDHLREARHALAPEGGADVSPQALEQASAHLLAAAVALTPEVTPEQTAAMRQRAEAAMERLDDHLMAHLAAGARAEGGV